MNKYKCTNNGLVLCRTIQYTRCFKKNEGVLNSHKSGKYRPMFKFCFRQIWYKLCNELSINDYQTLNMSIRYVMKCK